MKARYRLKHRSYYEEISSVISTYIHESGRYFVVKSSSGHYYFPTNELEYMEISDK